MNKSGYIPMCHKVLVKPDKVEEKTAGGLFIPPTTREQQQYAVTEGKVVAIGASACFDWPDNEQVFKAGDIVVFRSYAGFKLEGVDGETYRVIVDDDVFAVKE